MCHVSSFTEGIRQRICSDSSQMSLELASHVAMLANSEPKGKDQLLALSEV